MRVLSLLALCGAASAFVTPSLPTRRMTPRMAVDDVIGVDVETGDKPFDPLGLASTPEKLYKNRAIELKHGRLAMLGVAGIWHTAAGFHFPDPVFSEKSALGAITKIATERPLALLQILAVITWIELVAKQDPSMPPGQLGKDGKVFGGQFIPENEEDFAALQLKELKNGRLAMLGWTGLILQEIATGQSVWEQLGSGNVNPFGDGKGLF